MVSLKFLWALLTTPVTVVTTIVQYYTVGTIYQKTNKEFRHSLYKNVRLSVEYHLANTFQRGDVALFIYQPVTTWFKKYSKSPLTTGLNGYGEKIDDRTSWIVRAKDDAQKKTTIIFFHGGGYCINIFETQFVGATALYYTVPESKRAGLSIAILDYSLTCHGKNYPTQINEAMAAYRAIVNQGHEDIILIGDSCGVNLSLAVSRYIAYPEEAKSLFSQFSDFDWDFSPLPQPKHLILISPWLEPFTMPKLDPNFDYTGDLGSPDTTMGDWYLEGVDRKQSMDFVKFTDTDYATKWANIDAINGRGRTLYVYGEREHLRFGVESFIDTITKQGSGKLEVFMEEGGIHDGMFYVESIDFLGDKGAQKVLTGDFGDKYAFSLVKKLLSEVI